MNEYPVDKQKKLVIGAAIVTIILLVIFAYMNAAKSITIDLDGEVVEVKSYADTVDGLLNKEEILVKEKGYINYPLDKKLEDKMYIVIKEPKTYNIEIGEEIREKELSPYEKVEEILADLDLKVGGLDYSEPALDQKVKDGDTIKFYRVKEVTEDIENRIPFEEVITKNRDLDSGTTKVVQKGEEGIEETKVTKKYVNDELVDTKTINKTIVKKPVSQLVERGTRQIVASRGSGPKPASADLSNGVVMNATAYDLSYESCGKRPGDRGYGKTASGTQARPGAIAVDPRVIPLGTKLYIESLDGTPDYGYATAEDTGGAIKGNKVDLFFHSAAEVRNFGRRKVKVYRLN